jgi:hypothetical protein
MDIDTDTGFKLSAASMALVVIVRKAYGEAAKRTIRILRPKRNAESRSSVFGLRLSGQPHQPKT